MFICSNFYHSIPVHWIEIKIWWRDGLSICQAHSYEPDCWFILFWPCEIAYFICHCKKRKTKMKYMTKYSRLFEFCIDHYSSISTCAVIKFYSSKIKIKLRCVICKILVLNPMSISSMRDNHREERENNLSVLYISYVDQARVSIMPYILAVIGGINWIRHLSERRRRTSQPTRRKVSIL